MPMAPPKPCSVCGVLVRDGHGKCEAHRKQGTFADKQRGSRHERGYGSEWVKTRVRILKRDGGICQCSECKREGRLRIASQVDHKVNKAAWRARHGTLDGVDDDTNLQAINADCHKRKTAAEAQAGRG